MPCSTAAANGSPCSVTVTFAPASSRAAAPGSVLFAGIAPGTRFYFVHSYALRSPGAAELAAAGALVSWAEHGEPFAAAVEKGILAATQFHPEKSGDAGAALLANWLEAL